MGIKKMTKRILRDNFWIIQDFIKQKSDEEIADSIRRVADVDDGFANVIFELGVDCLIRTAGKDFDRG